ncbi:MAG: preprotein translocase subunit SecY [Gammaproteobacteria bacterium]|nr:preprotein translocase subunit SecY [Gammaproteobacteria bacterium]
MAKTNQGLSLTKTGLLELKQRVLFVFLAIVVYRIGCHIPVPGLDPQRVADLFSQHKNGIINLFNMFSGGALSRLTVFALGIMPYISASIIIQLLTVVYPPLEQLKKEGEAGRRKINQYTRQGTLLLATIQALGMSKWLASQGIALNPGFAFYFISTLTLATGTLFLMWLGEQMTERGIGNGISLIIFAGIVSRMPAAIAALMEQVRQGQIQYLALLVVLLVVCGVTAFVVFMERGQRQITINYAQRQQGRKMYAAQTSHLPLKINMAGVIPPIFASSIILLPATLGQWFGNVKGLEWLGDVGLVLSPGQPLYMLLYATAIVFFCFFYTALVFNPKETADNLKKSGAFIPGIRPGDQSAKYIDGVMSRLTLVGAVYITLVSLLPEFMQVIWHVPFYFGGTSLLIIVVVVMDFMSQIQAHLMSHQYESLLKKANLKGVSLR